jgi:DNA-binding NtrC family response regulator
MTRIALCSLDVKLPPLLAPALGRDFELVAEPNHTRIKQMHERGEISALLLDLDSECGRVEQQVEFFDEIITQIATVIITDDDARPTAIDLVTRGAHGYCRKPPALRELKAMLRRAAEHTAMKRELEGRGLPVSTAPAGPLGCEGLIGSSPEMCGVYDLIRRVANLNASVLIIGESGTGKELIARAIHNVGDRSQAPFIAVSCGAIPETLIESELFGHEKGAFTGTVGTRIGYFEQAGNGTIFIDEIGELSLQTQVKLLRVLQQREFTRLGSGRGIPLKARVILATHRDLNQMIAAGTFRLDLFYRINVMSIKAPSLRERPEDISVLADFFVKQYSTVFRKKVDGISSQALALLEEYDWPGNVRELENVIQSAIIRTDGDLIEPTDLPETFKVCALADEAEVPQVGSFETLLRDYKVRLANKAIEDCNGNKTLAARRLNISRAYLHRLIRLEDEPAEIEIPERQPPAKTFRASGD